MIAQTKEPGNIIRCGAIVKYNPCTSFARGSPCPHFDKVKKCDEPPLACEMPEYDRWYKDVRQKKRNCFYPNRMRLLENPNVPMFIFHIHYHAILGEAQIVRYTMENGNNFYWFNEFRSYPHPVQLELLRTDPRLLRLARGGRWLCVYISGETIEEIRNLSELPEEEIKKLGNDLRKLIEQLKERPLYKLSRVHWKIFMRNECKKLERHYELGRLVLNKTQEYFSRSVQKKLSIGSSFKERFYASLYLAFRMFKIPKLPNDITKMSGVSSKKLGKLYRLFARELNLIVPPLDPKQLIKSHSVELSVSKKTDRRAVFLLDKARKNKIIAGRAPSSVAAAATFVACKKEGENIKIEQIVESFGVSQVTIRKLSKEIEAL